MDWGETGELSKYCSSLRVTAHQFPKTLTVVCSIHRLLHDTHIYKQVSDSKLSAIPTQLWATSQYDVGLMTGATPVKVTPKSSPVPVFHRCIHSKPFFCPDSACGQRSAQLFGKHSYARYCGKAIWMK